MADGPSDALVFFGATGDLAFKKIFPALQAMARRGRLHVPIIGVAKAELFPSFALSGSIGLQATTGAGTGRFKDLFGPGSLVYRAGGSLFWPILQYPRIMNNVRAEDARYQQALVYYVNAVLVAAQEVEDGIAGFQLSQNAVVFAERASSAAETAVRLALVQYREGAVDYQRVLDTQRVLLESQNRLAEARSSVAINMIGLYKALGGGWEIRQGDPVVPDSTRREMKDRTYWGGYLTAPHRPTPENVPPPSRR